MVEEAIIDASTVLNILLTTAIELKEDKLTELALELIDHSLIAFRQYIENPLDCRPIEKLGKTINEILEEAYTIIARKKVHAA